MNTSTATTGKAPPPDRKGEEPGRRPARKEMRRERGLTLLRLLEWERAGRQIRDYTFFGMVVLIDLLLLYVVVRGEHTLESLEPGFVVALTMGAVSLACAFAVARLETLCMLSLQGASGVAAVGPLVRLLEADDSRAYRMAARMVARMVPKLSEEGLEELAEEDRNLLLRELEATSPNAQPGLLAASLGAFSRLRDPRACAAARALLTGPALTRREQRIRRAARDYLNAVARLDGCQPESAGKGENR